MKIKSLVAAMAVVLAAPAFATIAKGDAAEMFLVVTDQTAKVTYTLDLGVSFSAFALAADGIDAGYSKTWMVGGDANWVSFSAASTGTKEWAVVSLDDAGTSRNIITTVSGSTTAASVGNITRGQLKLASEQSVTFLSAVNAAGTHSSNANGSSYTTKAALPRGYFGNDSESLKPSFGNFGSFSSVNEVGKDSRLYLLAGASTPQATKLIPNLFENVQGAAVVSFDGAKLVYTLAPVPEPETYALMLAGLAAIGLMARRRAQA